MNRHSGIYLQFGLAFGFVFAAAGFNQYDVIHNMLLLPDAGPFLVMGSAVGVAMAILWTFERRRCQTVLGGPLQLRRRSVKRKHIYGDVVVARQQALLPLPAERATS